MARGHVDVQLEPLRHVTASVSCDPARMRKERRHDRDPHHLLFRRIQAGRRSVRTPRSPAGRAAGRHRTLPRLHGRQGPLPAGQRAGARRGRVRGPRLRLQGLGRERGTAYPTRPIQPGRGRPGRPHLPRGAGGGGRSPARHLRHELRRRDSGVDRSGRQPGPVHRERRRHRARRALDAQRAPARRMVRPAGSFRGGPRQAHDGRRVGIRRSQPDIAARPPIGGARGGGTPQRPGCAQHAPAGIRGRDPGLSSGMGGRQDRPAPRAVHHHRRGPARASGRVPGAVRQGRRAEEAGGARRLRALRGVRGAGLRRGDAGDRRLVQEHLPPA